MRDRREDDRDVLRQVVEAWGLGVWEWDPATDRCRCRGRLLEQLGMSPAQAPGTLEALRDRVHPDDRDGLRAALENHVRGRAEHHRHAYRIRHADGRWLWFEERALIASRDGDGHPTLVVGACDDVTERQNSRRGVEWLALHDPLTQLPNRAAFLRRLRALWSATLDVPAALLVLDLDRFKAVNDEWGHAVGDQVLALVGRRLRGRVRRTDLVSRIGGDEFAILIQRNDEADPGVVAGRVVVSMREPFRVGEAMLAVTASAGLAMVRGGPCADDVLARADAALYEAKRSGRDTWRREPGSPDLAGTVPAIRLLR
ncbi:MAG TPA: sensor domain-containing diguanylate cyclase [Candidatus Dormibacteraeota bacterium]|jgi:diguanylate cyclase (GGDEF)-like protein/PAS domain S-box-containing protein|nr:sensor domain-containing diguanylate cyclase [Candidatus Dormibacteraeota bacterium]